MKAKRIYIHGPAGVGKSELAKVLARFHERHGGDVFIFDEFRATGGAVDEVKKASLKNDFVIVVFQDPGALHFLPPAQQVIEVTNGGQRERRVKR